METFYKINNRRLDSLAADFKNSNKNFANEIDEFINLIIEESAIEVSTYSELEFLMEKRRFLLGKGIDLELDKIELVMLSDLNFKIDKIINKK